MDSKKTSDNSFRFHVSARLVIRPAQLADAPAIARVHVASWQSAYSGLMPQSFLDSLSVAAKTASWSKLLSGQSSDTHTLVAELDSRLVGFCTVGHCRDQDLPANVAELWSIYVAPGFTGQGIGTALHQQALRLLVKLGFTQAVLWVLDSNQNARSWYENRGWRPEGRTKTDPRPGFTLLEIRYITNL